MTGVEEVPLLPLPSPEERYKLRKQLMGLTIAQAAGELGVAPNSLRRWEKGYPLTAGNHRKYQAAIQRWQETIDSYLT